MKFEFRDGVPYVVGPPMSAREAFDESRPLPRSALYALGWTDEMIDAAEAKAALKDASSFSNNERS